MRYGNVRRASFIDRPNRFIARVWLDGRTESVHVKNTGRCRELLVPGAEVWLTEPGTPGRKTRYDLIAVRKGNGVLFNIDSQAPNRAAAEWQASRGYDRIIPEYRRGDSRIDLCLERGGERTLMEVKGCTLEADGVGLFPDTPTVRGAKHIRELIRAVDEGFRAVLAFVIQMDGVTAVRANAETDPGFAAALEEAVRAGVEIAYMPCHVEPDSLTVRQCFIRGREQSGAETCPA